LGSRPSRHRLFNKEALIALNLAVVPGSLVGDVAGELEKDRCRTRS
jgi:hypothetical protein